MAQYYTKENLIRKPAETYISKAMNPYVNPYGIIEGSEFRYGLLDFLMDVGKYVKEVPGRIEEGLFGNAPELFQGTTHQWTEKEKMMGLTDETIEKIKEETLTRKPEIEEKAYSPQLDEWVTTEIKKGRSIEDIQNEMKRYLTTDLALMAVGGLTQAQRLFVGKGAKGIGKEYYYRVPGINETFTIKATNVKVAGEKIKNDFGVTHLPDNTLLWPKDGSEPMTIFRDGKGKMVESETKTLAEYKKLYPKSTEYSQEKVTMPSISMAEKKGLLGKIDLEEKSGSWFVTEDGKDIARFEDLEQAYKFIKNLQSSSK